MILRILPLFLFLPLMVPSCFAYSQDGAASQGSFAVKSYRERYELSDVYGPVDLAVYVGQRVDWNIVLAVTCTVALGLLVYTLWHYDLTDGSPTPRSAPSPASSPTEPLIVEPVIAQVIPDITLTMDMALQVVDQTLVANHGIQSLFAAQDYPNVTLGAPVADPLEQLTGILNHQHSFLEELRKLLTRHSLDRIAADPGLAKALSIERAELLRVRELLTAQGEEFFTNCSNVAKSTLISEYQQVGPALVALRKAFGKSLEATDVAQHSMATGGPVVEALEPLQGLLLTVLLSLGLLRCTGSRRLSAPRVTLSLGGLGLSLATTTLLLSLGQTLLLSLVAAMAVRLVVVLLLRRRCAWFRRD